MNSLLLMRRWSIVLGFRSYKVNRVCCFQFGDHFRCLLKNSGENFLLSQIQSRNVVKSCAYLFRCKDFWTFQSKTPPEINEKEDLMKEESTETEEKKLSLVQRYKKMLKEYWYVLIPVHVATSVVWFGSFYYIAKSGIDIVPYLEAVGFAEKLLEPFKNSSLGYLAVASAMYKLATPARYMVTLGGTTLAINSLTKKGYLKPMPSHQQIKTMIQQRRKKS